MKTSQGLLIFVVLLILSFQAFALQNSIPSSGEYFRRIAESRRLQGVEAGYKIGYYTQILDHFNYRGNKTWQHRYVYNDTFWSGPKNLGKSENNEDQFL